ncbi:tetratricopeptide repeat protein [Tindallia californiensis]|uniref:Tetratricopeptide repeat-containing protein n=1 Tax=Tindallia californiensis TaxID=159292 RepID=A0A1H3QFW7_9FIRM|nr:tetratricopeptide repeat protein [Tindallia californiensis]SDZ12163.1 Tetratricopeptide repeat-containing protein [Tindallia californiensis]
MKTKDKMLTLLFCCVILLAGCGNSLEKGMQEAEEWLESGQYEKAMERYEALIESHPEETALYVGMANALIGLGEQQEAVKILEKGKELSENPAELREGLAVLYVQLEYYEKAESLYQEILKEEASEAIYLSLLELKQKQYKYEELTNLFEKHKAIFSNDTVLIYAADAYARQGKRELAQEIVGLVELQNLDEPETVELLLGYYLDIGMMEEAVSTAMKGLEIDGSNHQFLSIIHVQEDWPGYYIIDRKKADYTGDRKEEQAVLLSDSPSGSHASELLLLVIDLKTGKAMDMFDGAIGGYPWNLEVEDFTGNQAAEILMAAHSGGSGGGVFYNLLSFENATMNELELPAPQLKHRFVDDYMAVISYPELQRSFTFQLGNQEAYEEFGLYHNSMVLDPVMNGFARSFRLEPYYSESEERYGLEYIAPLVSGPALAAEVADVSLPYLWIENRWQAVDMRVDAYDDNAREIAYDPLDPSDFSDNLIHLLGMNLRQVREIMGEPNDIGWYGGDAYSYDDFTVVVDDRNNVGMVLASEWMGAARGDHLDTVKNVLGEPTIDEIDRHGFYGHYMTYELGDRYSVTFDAAISNKEVHTILLMLK